MHNLLDYVGRYNKYIHFESSSSIKELVDVNKNGLLFSSSSELADELMVSFLIVCLRQWKIAHKSLNMSFA